MNKSEIIEFFAEEFPHYDKISIDEVGQGSATIRHRIGRQELRPGGTVAGPVSMLLADVVIYVAILGQLGRIPLTVTTSLNINFLRKPSAQNDLIAQCELIKVGKTLIVGKVNLYSEGSPELVAHVVGTYAVPPLKSHSDTRA
jgi:uncharacterized protein (TIGR00369 family)